MKSGSNKVTSLDQAIKTLVPDGCHLSIGGFTINRNPMAAVYEIIRQRKKDLHLYAHSNGQGVDELIGAGCVKRLEIAYAGSGRFAPTCIRFRKAVESGTLQVEDYSNYQMTLRFMAGAMGVPFLPTRSGLGTDIIKKSGFPEELRAADKKLPPRKLVTIANPFGEWGAAPKLVLVPAINPDVTIIHVQQADQRGNCRIKGLTFADVEQAKAARHLIITCEELVSEDYLKQEPDHNQIPFIQVDAVIPIPWGAWPTACYKCYDYDPEYLQNYRQAAADDKLYRKYLAENIINPAAQSEFRERIPASRRQTLAADSETGYATGLERGGR